MISSTDVQTRTARKIQITSGCDGANRKPHGGGGEGLQTGDAHEPHKPVPQCVNDISNSQVTSFMQFEMLLQTCCSGFCQ